MTVAIETEVVKVAKEVKAEVAKVAEEIKAEVVKAVEKTTQEISTEEKLVIREIENDYLKAQMEIQRLSQITQAAQKNFTTTVETLTNKYAIDPAVFVFDNVKLLFTRKP